MSRRNTLSQAATMSPEGAAFLKTVPNFPVPRFAYRFLAGPARIPAFRKQFQDGEDVIEEALIAEHDLIVTRREIAGVPVVVVTPSVIDPARDGAVVFNIHGGGFVMGTGRERNALLTAAELRVPVYSVDYTLAPEAKYPVAIEQCYAVYTELIKTIDPQHVRPPAHLRA